MFNAFRDIQKQKQMQNQNQLQQKQKPEQKPVLEAEAEVTSSSIRGPAVPEAEVVSVPAAVQFQQQQQDRGVAAAGGSLHSLPLLPTRLG